MFANISVISSLFPVKRKEVFINKICAFSGIVSTALNSLAYVYIEILVIPFVGLFLSRIVTVRIVHCKHKKQLNLNDEPMNW